jgi:hypothetical protein
MSYPREPERERRDAPFVGIAPFFNGRRTQLVNVATRHALHRQLIRQHYDTILASLGLPDVDHHPGAVDIVNG